MKTFLETLNYTSSNENGQSEIKALDICSGDTVLCITGSGARPLDLLTKKVARIISIDFNPFQNFLLELKICAIRALDYDDFLEFLGICYSKRRVDVYRCLRKALTADARECWDRNLRMIEKGVIYQGRWERYFRKLARLLQIIYPNMLDRIFGCGCVEEQAMLWQEMRCSSLWRRFLHLSTSHFAWKYLFRDPGFYAYLKKGFSVYEYLDDRLTAFFNNQKAGESPFATLLFFGRYNPDRCLPLHLRSQHFKTLKENLACIQIVTQALQEYILNYSKNGPNKYSLSDVASYTSPGDYRMFWKHLAKSAPQGARVCERQFLVKRQLPNDVDGFVTRDTNLEDELARTDDSIFYTFVVAKMETCLIGQI